MPSEQEMIQQRLDKRARLLQAADPYPARVRRTHTTAAAVEAFTAGGEVEGATEVTVVGRVTAQRVMGKAAFLDLRDGSGRLQLHFRRDVLDDFEHLSLVDLGDFLEVTGSMFRTRTGEVTVGVASWRVITKALRPLPEKWHGLTDTEARYRQRYLDLIANERSREIARSRSIIVSAIRQFFLDRGFLEVETPVLQEHAGGAAARPFLTHHNALDRDLFMRISLELHLKRLLVGGFEKVFEIGRVFRNEGVSYRHNPEFTLLESYEAYADYHDVAAMVEELLGFVAMRVHGTTEFNHGDVSLSLKTPFARTTYHGALLEHTGIDYRQYPTTAALLGVARARNVPVSDGASWATILDGLMSTFVEPKLVQPTFIFDYPTALSPLAKKKVDDEDTVERFELFALGYEIANAYSELNDPVDQRERMEAQSAKQVEGDDEVEVADEDFLVAIEHGMPPAGGLGIGVDRVVQLITGEHSLREVILFPTMRDRGDE
ncbi:MAG: lysine--tRNA ligase [Chloroflexi bacterium]|nr:lysine--tRNA ligase [Chloroflexota bacterium]MDA1240310.1 lysine--tRNA ligase [Chloroflexota bacterium]MQC47775.1 lysine--tRNA ligase [Chloroflexota bacterium]